MIKTLQYLPYFLGFVIRRFPLARITIFITISLLLLEYALLSVMIPLAAVGGASANGSVLKFWQFIAEKLHLPAIQSTWLWFFLILLALRLVIGYVHILSSSWLAKQVHKFLSNKTFGRILNNEPMIEIYRRSIGYYVSLAGDDTFRAGTIVNTALQTFAGIASAFAGFLLLYLFSQTVFFATIIFIAICGIFVGFSFRLLLSVNKLSIDLSRELGTAFIEVLNGLRSVRSMACEIFVQNNYSAQIEQYLRLLFLIDVIKYSMKVVPGLLLLIVGIIYLWPGTPVATGLTAIYFLAVTTILLRIFMSLGVTVNSFSTLFLDMRAANDILDLIRYKEISKPINLSSKQNASIKLIVIKDLAFSYSGDKSVLSAQNFRFEAGKVYAIVGSSGSGKSTLADILLGLVKPSHGEVQINEGDAPLSEFRSKVVLVEQQVRIFSVSVRENMLLGLPHSDEELWNALSVVELDDYVRSLPDGLDTILDYQGANFSGGQRQRLGIARALLRDPDVLILDEATSALDNKTRDAVAEKLRLNMRDRILIFITHENVIANLADVVLSLDAPHNRNDDVD